MSGGELGVLELKLKPRCVGNAQVSLYAAVQLHLLGSCVSSGVDEAEHLYVDQGVGAMSATVGEFAPRERHCTPRRLSCRGTREIPSETRRRLRELDGEVRWRASALIAREVSMVRRC